MSHSEDEDDFLSADEDNFVPDSDNLSQVISDSVPNSDPQEKDTSDEIRKCNTSSELSQTSVGACDADVESSTSALHEPENSSLSVVGARVIDVNPKSKSDKDLTTKPIATIDGDELEEDEEALAERIRERNLKIARKFSAEIAKNVQSSAPIPVKSLKPPHQLSDPSLDLLSPSQSLSKSDLPPAPPPTPALSSSFNTSEELSSPNSTTAGTTQCSWRVPKDASISERLSKASAREKTLSSLDSSTDDRARTILERLSESTSRNDNKNLINLITEDVKKVSIKQPSSSETQGSMNIPILSDIGTTFGSWGWGQAGKFLASATQVTSQVSGTVLASASHITSQVGGTVLASASQVTSQVGSVLETVKKVSDSHVPQVMGSSTVDSKEQEDRSDQSKSEVCERNVSNKSHLSESDKKPNDKDIPSNEAVELYPEAIDYTLNAMESLGKMAFNVMTERDQSGSLQIKKIGRPWEHLMGTKKDQQVVENAGQSKQGVKDEPTETDVPDQESIIEKTTVQVDKPVSSNFELSEVPTLKNRKRRSRNFE